MSGEADKAFSAPYTGVEAWISGQSWVSKALEGPLNAANQKLDALAAALAESAKREDTALAAIQALAAGGSSIDTAAVTQAIRDAGTQESTAVAALTARIGELEQQLAALRAAEAKAAQDAANALNG